MQSILRKYLPNVGYAFFRLFSSLLPVQKEAIPILLDGNNALIISSTGSGKTEAAMAPIMENAIHRKDKTHCIYICPTKALVNDIYKRLSPIIETRLGLRIAVRTGDRNTIVRKNKPCVVITTPESFNVLVDSSKKEVKEILNDAKVIVIDEIHQFYNTVRGQQLKILLKRIRKERDLQIVALSATVANPNMVSDWLKIENDMDIKIIPVSSKRNMHVELYMVNEVDNVPCLDEIPSMIDYFGIDHKKILLFANSRRDCEYLCNTLRNKTDFKDRVYVHYSSLSQQYREYVEEIFKRYPTGLCIATSTLELGIDIGDIDAIAMYGAPESISSFMQRLGRGNRKTDTSIVYGICRWGYAGKIDLLKFIALVALAVQSEVEDMPPRSLYSVIVQQIFSSAHKHGDILFREFDDILTPEIAPFVQDGDTKLILDKLYEDGYLELPPRRNKYIIGNKLKSLINLRKIWGNFPSNPPSIKANSEQMHIADIPKENNFNKGEIILLTGKKHRVKESRPNAIELEEYSGDREHKDINWLGMGAPTPLELAQMMKNVLDNQFLIDEIPVTLGNRTKILYDALRYNASEIDFDTNICCESASEIHGYYRYYTFLGTIGNLVLTCHFRGSFLYNGIGFEYDEISVSASQPIVFKNLPKSIEDIFRIVFDNIEAFKKVINTSEHFNRLPRTLQEREIFSYVNDQRLLDKFRELESMEIVHHNLFFNS